jgi:copper type II ascorbate-dependent monooxygenase-like protein
MRTVLAAGVPLLGLILIALGVPSVRGRALDLRPIVLTARPGRVPPGEEIQRCHRLRLPRRDTVEIGRVRMFVRGGSHHVHLYRPYNGPPAYPPLDCPFAVDFDHWQLVAATQKALLDWMLPPGVAIQLAGREPLMIQTHFVNGGALSTPGRARARITLDPVDPRTVTAHAGAIFAQDRLLSVPPGRTTVKSRCTVTGDAPDAREMTILAFTGHYHFRGVAFDVYRVGADGALGERVYHHDGYGDPDFTQYKGPDALVLHPGEGIEWWCTYQNDGTETYEFGPNTQRNEHCNLFGFYYPTATPHEAIDCIHLRDDAGVERTRRIVAE